MYCVSVCTLYPAAARYGCSLEHVNLLLSFSLIASILRDGTSVESDHALSIVARPGGFHVTWSAIERLLRLV